MRLPPRLFGGFVSVPVLVGLTAWGGVAGVRAAEGGASLPIEQREPLSVGAFTDAYPYSYIGANGAMTGFAVDILDAVAKAENFRVERVQGPATRIRERFQKGEFDLLQYRAVSSASRADAAFSVPFLSLQGCVFVKAAGSPIQRLSDFDGRAFGVIGTTGLGEKLLADNHVTARIVQMASQDELLGHIASGEVAGGFLSQLSELSITQRHHIDGIRMLGRPFHGYDINQAFAVHTGDSELLLRLNEGLAIIHRSGEYDRIYRKNFGQFGSYILTTAEIELYASIILACAFLVALWAFFRQRRLRRELSVQAAKLSEQGSLLHALYDNIPMAMTVIESGPAGDRVLSMNRYACELYSVILEPGGPTLDALPVSDEVRRHLLKAVERDPGDGPPETHEVKLRDARRILDVNTVPLETPGGPEISRICVLVEDVTDRKLQDAEIAQSRKMRAVGELVGGIAHEFNNLLTPVMLKAGEIQLTRPDDAELQNDIEVITQAVRRTAELTRRLLTFGRKGDPKADAIRLEAAVAGCFDLLKNTVDRRITWESRIPPGMKPLYHNAADLNQIILNLLLNARDTLLEKLSQRSDGAWSPSIRVDAEELPANSQAVTGRHEGEIPLAWQRLTVRDNGLGMPSEVLERAFEPFFSTKSVGKGTGLGLATVWHLVTDAGGRVAVDSSPGQGTVFSLFLPVWPVVEKNAPSSPRAPLARRARVLLIEDEHLVAGPISEILRRSGHQVRHFDNGLDAWRHLEGNFPGYDLLIVDVDLPGINGIDVVSRARERSFPGRIFMVSGRFTSANMSELTRLKIDHTLTKPFDAKQLVDAVSRCLEGGLS